jgi:tRNA (uracil-5-)-methyltransferase
MSAAGEEENGDEKDESLQCDDHQNHEKDDRITSGTSDPYQYIVRDGGTSCELFKIEVHNLPRYTSYATLKKLFNNKFSLKPQKIKLIGNPLKFAFVALRDEQDREKALQSISGFSWKGCKLQATIAAPKADPLVMKRTADSEKINASEKKFKARESPSDVPDKLTESELCAELNDRVATLWRLPYAEQLIEKTKLVDEFLVDLHKEIGRMIDHSKKEPSIAGGQESKDLLFKWYMSCKKNYDRKSCPVQPIRPSPVIDGYRNKCEFSFGTDKIVGFRLGCYKDGSVRVAPPALTPIVPVIMKKIVLLVQTFLKQSSKVQPFDHVTHEGNWKQLMIRTNSTSEAALVVLSAAGKGLNEEQIANEKKLLSDALSSEPSIVSLYLEVTGKKSADRRLQLIFGEPFMTEHMKMHGKELSFRVSPDAFFQINTPAAEVCYETIAEALNLRKDTLLLDVCCGTGMIGISLADRVSRVIGIELNDEAVKDAEKNAEANHISNIQFMAGKAEDLVMKAITSANKQDDFKKIVAIIDPPRAGLSKCSLS